METEWTCIHIGQVRWKGLTNPLKKQTFIQGAIILMAAGILNRIFGFIPRMVLPRLIGAEGVGLYQMGYPLLIVLLTVITGGIPLAVSKLVAEAESKGQPAQAQKILRNALTISITIGIVFTIGLILASSLLTETLFTDNRVQSVMIVMSPIILLVSISAVLRGYFQGKQNMIPTALSQISETIVRAGAMLLFAYLMLPYGLEYAAAAAMGGVVTGEIAGLLLLLFSYARRNSEQKRSKQKQSHQTEYKGNGFKRLIQIAIPVTASKLVGSASYFMESIMIIQSLAIAGVTAKLATAQYGALQGMVIPIMLLPTALSYSLSVSLIPSLSEAAARGQYQLIHKRLHQSLRLALVTGAPFAVIMYILAEPLCLLLYRDATVAPMLRMLAPVAIFVYLQAPFQATLQALDKPGSALLNTFIGASIKLILIYLLAAKAKLGIDGAIIAICVNITLVTLLHSRSVYKLLGFRLRSSDLFKVAFSASVTGLLIVSLLQVVSAYHALPFFVILVLCILCYLCIIISLKLIDADDLRRLPIIKRWMK